MTSREQRLAAALDPGEAIRDLPQEELKCMATANLRGEIARIFDSVESSGCVWKNRMHRHSSEYVSTGEVRMGSVVVSGNVDEQHRLSAEVPASIPPGPVVITIRPAAQEDEASHAWFAGIAREWADELGDPRQDIYTLQDGEPVSES